MKRKVVRVGASLCILLPKKIITKVGWDFGDHIDLILDEDEQKITLKDYEETEKKNDLGDFSQFKTQYKEAFQEDE
ncbi:MAG: AbrB/MazE/SpoVT family DNA-binding domain-containing protein [Candidatus Marinimicrobia bacterium]|nr:AbrB/MazE/SpoVT family DNA-binding domain-containing protein [Candidatus Neomarinimicrobiota bacterium]